MIYVISDTHGDLARFRAPALRRLRRGDTLIVLGDFGFVWDDSPAERRALRWLGRRRYQLLFLDGSHENFDLLAAYPQVELGGAPAWQLGRRLYRLQRGALYTIEDRTLLVLGGAESLDREARQEGVTWWPQELPTAEDFARCDAALQSCGGQVDFILTHDGPTRLLRFLKMNRDSVLYEENALEVYLDGLMEKARYRLWCFGRYHLDQKLGPTAAAVYKKPLPLWQQTKGKKRG